MRSANMRQRGYILPMTLVIMVVGAIAIAALFSYLGFSLRLLGMNQRSVDAYYAADSGIEYALAQFRDVVGEVPPSGAYQFDTYVLNDKDVDVAIEKVGGGTYRIISTASDENGGKTIESYVIFHDYSFLVEGAIVSNGDVTIKPGCEVSGDVTYTGDMDNKGEIDGEVNEVDTIEPWPDADFLSWYYRQQVEDLEPFPDSTIDVRYVDSIGPLRREGALTVWNTSNTNLTVPLDGTVYVEEQLDMAQSGKEFTIDLNGQTIFVDYRGTGDAIRMGPKLTLTGSGCIIAVGDIRFQPNIASGPDDYILLMSIEGTVLLQPNGDFYGTIVGNVSVDLQPGCSVYYTNPGDDGLNFVYAESAVFEVLTYNIQ